MRELLRKPTILWGIATIILTAVVLGVVVEIISWEELPKATTISILAIGLLLSVALYWYGYIQYKHQKSSKDNKSKNEYLDKIIIDSKAPMVLEITNTLQAMAGQQNIVTMEELSRRRVSAKFAAKLQKESQKRLNIQPKKDFPVLTDAKKSDLMVKEIKKAGLYKRDFDETHVQYLLTIEWVLDKYNKGLSLKLERNDRYQELEKELRGQMAKVSREESINAIVVYLDTCLAINSLMLYRNYFPKTHINQLPAQANKQLHEIKHDRDIILSILLQRIKKLIEEELRGRTK